MEHQRYKITDRLDAGGMAEVFRGVAESTVGGLKRNVAIKRILPNLTKNKKFVQMFLDEARLALHLQHANIVQVYDIGVSDAAPPGSSAAAVAEAAAAAEAAGEHAYFLVMEYVDGANLKVIIDSLRAQNVRLPVSQGLYIMMEVCKALSYAHDLVDPETGRALGIVHRDISPPNILLSRRGEVKLADFGLAKATSQLEGTDPGVVKGKFSYLSPEAAMGQDVDRRADIFAVGILTYEMLTGKRLFEAETDYRTVELVRTARVPSISQQNPDVGPELEAIVRKSLARDPAQRYQRADDLGDALAQYLFSHNLKVTNRDIENQVARCLADKVKVRPDHRQSSLIDTLIQDEILKFTSLDDVAAQEQGKGLDVTGGAPLNPEQFVDTSGWASELEPLPGGDAPNLTQDDGRPAQPQRPARPDKPPVLASSFPETEQSLERILEGTGAKQLPAEQPRSKVPWIILAALLVVGVALLIYFLP